MAQQHKCPICGKPTYSYFGNERKDHLCYEHGRLANDGEIEQCPNCGKWHDADKKCTCKQNKITELPTTGFNSCQLCGNPTNGYAFCKKCYNEHNDNELLTILNKKNKNHKETAKNNIDNINKNESSNNKSVSINQGTSKCITCGRQTNGFPFCSNCFHKYKNKDLLIKIKNCSEFELLDENYEGRYTCKDGHVVKSKSEREIDNYLFEHDIRHAYERELPYGAEENEVLHPDFFLPNYLGENKHVYIEHWGYNENNIQYTKTKKFKMPIYEKLGITLICTYEKSDSGKIDTVLDRKLNKNNIKEGQINFKEK